MPDIVCLGQFTADVVVTPVGSLPKKGTAILVDSISLHNGGCACNTAVSLGKLGIDAAVIGKVGCDTFGDFLIKVMSDANLDTSGIVRDAGVKTSATAVLISPDGERSFLHYSGANATMTADDVDYGLIEKARILHVAAAFLVPSLDGGPMARVLEKARKMGVTTSLDTAWDAEGRWMELLEPCLAHVDLFMPSIEEAQMLSGKKDPEKIAEFFLDYGIGTVLLKLGADGCYIRTADQEFVTAAFKVEKIVDTLGAGDCHAAGFLAATVNGWDLRRACSFANAVGAACVTDRGTSGIRAMEQTVRQYLLNE
ncbi:MAG: carbohydrate kinase family protein [Planctomycetota bacterium]|jgi:sugar/nucleoside kinase (ribokinase family)